MLASSLGATAHTADEDVHGTAEAGRTCRDGRRCSVRRMGLADLVFLLGPVGAVVLVPVAVAVLAVRRQPRWAVWLGICLALIVSAAWLGYWFLWGRGFDSADAFQPVPAAVDTGLGVTMTVAAVGTAAFTVLAAAALVTPRRPR
jgi:hypothetical protein